MTLIWSDNTLNRLAQIVEEEISSKLNVILDRYALPVRKGIYDYTLPNYMVAIRRVAWRGFELNPRDRMDQIRSSTTPFATTMSQPREYLISGMGYFTLRLIPGPQQDLIAPSGDLWNPLVYNEACIVEMTRSPDITDDTFRIPEFLRRVMFKDSILARALAQEGPGQNFKASTYYNNKSKLTLTLMNLIKDNLWLFCPKVMSPDPSRVPRINHPVLPPNFPARG